MKLQNTLEKVEKKRNYVFVKLNLYNVFQNNSGRYDFVLLPHILDPEKNYSITNSPRLLAETLVN